ncbi:hypothetical protein SOVF_044090, partial [Spinacia oleracea]
MHILHM